MPKQLFIFGDSITFGAWDTKGGWAQRLRNYYDKLVIESDFDFYCLTYILGVSGDTTGDLLKRFDFEVQQRFELSKDTTFLFAIGINDSQSFNDGFQTSPEEFKENIKKLIKLTQRYGGEVVFLGLTPVDEKLVFSIPWACDRGYKNENVEQYNQILEQVSNETNNVSFLSAYEVLQMEDLQDGVHPNAEGHQKIFEVVSKYLDKTILN